MIKYRLLSLVLFTAMISSLDGADTFEGQYDMELSGDGETHEISFLAKGGHIRMKMSGKGQQMGEMILRDGLSSMIMIMPQQRMYMEMPIPADSFTPDAPDAETSELPFKKTGRTKEILGYEAAEFIFEHEGEKMTIWATEELGSMPFANNPMLQGWTDVMRRVTGLKAFFPLESIGTKNGKETYRMVVKKVEEKSLPDDLFLPPDGYRKMVLPAGMGGFMPGG